MKAALTRRYGPSNVLEVGEVARPKVGPHDVLVEVVAAAVTAGDRRIRAADFPSFSAVIGRLMFGILRPRTPVQGTMFAGRVVAIGAAVTRYAVGDDVFGSADSGAYAEFLSLDENATIGAMPKGWSYAEAAAVPYGAGTAMHFLRDLGEVGPGAEVLIVGASGGVGRYAVQLAKHMGAVVTGVCSRRNFELVRGLGADHVIDYKTTDFADNGRTYDVIFDISGTTTFSRSRPALKADGRYLTLYLSVGVLLQMAMTSRSRGQKAMFSIATGDRDKTMHLAELMQQGVIRPVVASRFPFARIADAHAEADSGRSDGDVVVMVGSDVARSSSGAEEEAPRLLAVGA